MGVAGYTFGHLHDPERLASLYERFCEDVVDHSKHCRSTITISPIISRGLRVTPYGTAVGIRSTKMAQAFFGRETRYGHRLCLVTQQ